MDIDLDVLRGRNDPRPSVWIDYFHDGEIADTVEEFLDRKELCVNDIILAELLPSIQQRGERELKNILCKSSLK